MYCISYLDILMIAGYTTYTVIYECNFNVNFIYVPVWWNFVLGCHVSHILWLAWGYILSCRWLPSISNIHKWHMLSWWEIIMDVYTWLIKWSFWMTLTLLRNATFISIGLVYYVPGHAHQRSMVWNLGVELEWWNTRCSRWNAMSLTVFSSQSSWPWP